MLNHQNNIPPISPEVEILLFGYQSGVQSLIYSKDGDND
jgi:hypothetical protein